LAAHPAQGSLRCECWHWTDKGRSGQWWNGGGLAPQGVNNLGEALAAICSLASFPPMSGAPVYKLWEARLQELSCYVQRYPVVERRGLSPLVREIRGAAAPGGGAANTKAHRGAAGLGLACPTQPTAVSPRPTTPVAVQGRPALTTEISCQQRRVPWLSPCVAARRAAVRRQQEWHGPAQGSKPLRVWRPLQQRRGQASAPRRGPWLLSQDPSQRREAELGLAVPWVLPWS
jgi:hypothetical protein